MRRIPKTFKLLSHTVNVRIIDKKDWKYKEDLAFWDPDKNEIWIMRQPRTQLRHTFWHEAMHAMLDTLSHRLARDEQFVDQMGGLLAQMMDTAEF